MLARRRSKARRHREADTTVLESLVEQNWQCSICLCSVAYLDAAPNIMRCVQCDCPLDNVPTTIDGYQWYKPKLGASGTTNLGRGAFVDYIPDLFLSSIKESPGQVKYFTTSNMYRRLIQEIPFKRLEDLLPSGRVVRQPRLIAYQSVDHTNPRYIYDYPGLSRPLIPTAFSPTVKMIKTKVEKATGISGFNSVHLNWYRDGRDHVSWHTDEDRPLYGANPVIASVSLGAERNFVLRPCRTSGGGASQKGRLCFSLKDGSLLIMRGTTQEHWEHAVLKAQNEQAGDGGGLGRINMTFRIVK